MTEFTKIFRRTSYLAISPSASKNGQGGRSVLVTGGSEVLGFGITQAFAEARAARVVSVSRSQWKLDQAYHTLKSGHPNVDWRALSYDVSNVTQIQNLWAQLAKENIFVDILVLGASATQPPKDLDEQISKINFNLIAHLHSLERSKSQPNPE